MIPLRTVPTFVTAHILSANFEILWFSKGDIRGLNYAEKPELNKCSWYLERKLGVAMHFSEIIKL